MLFVVAGPSGVGKSYLIRTLLDNYPELFASPPLITTRPPRPGQEVDRISVTAEQFAVQRSASEFVIADQFNSHWYGFPAAVAQPQAQHVIINAWPALLPQFASLPEVTLIGLSVEPGKFDLLRDRMRQRGDSDAVVASRLQQVAIDTAELQSQRSLVEQHGKLFSIEDDSTIPEQVIPWVLQLVTG